ncbi:unnamed protein product [Kuraishia capsulata CBS 1993]|uniref:Ras-GAP domain-containing protein n=1 Tax=Kuraishia capsulata CBS 1993 TaxID=1382522 RepID=W6MT71_9ASCO|nr:uncharacterized protein KUCA_T00005933001 [Kuraishia capsulata CBS 1993]CDK29939.1 unnamed protein product [Kuraishia capsulata CBS 1993]
MTSNELNFFHTKIHLKVEAHPPDFNSRGLCVKRVGLFRGATTCLIENYCSYNPSLTNHIPTPIMTNNELESRGTFERVLSWSFHIKSEESWKSAIVSITNDGKLLAGSEVLIDELQRCNIQILFDKYCVLIERKVYIQGPKTDFIEFIKVLSSWQSLGREGFSSKWHPAMSITEQGKVEGNQLLVCRFKVFAPLPFKSKHIKIAGGPAVPMYPLKTPDATLQEDWFYVMGHLKSDGILNLLHEGDGSLLYSVDVSQLFTSEIIQIDHSMFQNSNTLFVGFIDELRRQQFPNEYPFLSKQRLVRESFLKEQDSKNITRLLIQFPLHIDLEDWFVTLKAFAKREHYYLQHNPDQKLRSSKHVTLEVTEAKFSPTALPSSDSNSEGPGLYAELSFWGATWCRTAIVKSRTNPFWKENFKLECPCSTESARILVKKCSFKNEAFSQNDVILGESRVDLTQSGKSTDKRLIIGSSNLEIGSLDTTLTVGEIRILPHNAYKIFESMLRSLPPKDLQEMVITLQSSSNDLETLSSILLDSFQSLGIETELFAALRETAMKPLDSMTRQNRVNAKTTSPNSLNTVFRGNSALTKCLEMYFLRVGHEYLEKVIGPFVQRISDKNIDCEVDPRAGGGDAVAKTNLGHLTDYVNELWELMYSTTNDLPRQIKDQLTFLRKDVENSVEPDDIKTPLNALSAFIFLRFMCPALLNPKLFFLAKEHQTGRTQRTLMLVAKILMMMANRGKFSEYKEPYMVGLNTFLEEHDQMVIDYFDKLTGRKMDFSERILDMSDVVSRLSVEVPPAILSELPTNPYLIDKYHSLVQLIHCLNETRSLKKSSSAKHISSEPQMLQIDDVDFGSQEFLSSLLESSSSDLYDTNLSSFLRQNVTFQDLLEQAAIVEVKSSKLCELFNKPELPSDFTAGGWSEFEREQFSSGIVDKKGHLGHINEKLKECRPLEDVLQKLLLQTSPSFDSLASTPTVTAKPEKRLNPITRLFRKKKT